jgi:hypothetical protein
MDIKDRIADVERQLKDHCTKMGARTDNPLGILIMGYGMGRVSVLKEIRDGKIVIDQKPTETPSTTTGLPLSPS